MAEKLATSETERPAASLHEAIVSRLRDFLVEGGLEDGARIPERQLCDMLSISRTPLREALKVLAAEGIVELLPNRGARVRKLGPGDLVDLFDVIGGLEALAGRLACERITNEEVAEIERLHHEMYGFYLHRDVQGYFRLNQQIHRRILAAARNTILSNTYTSFAGMARRVRYSALLAKKRDRWGDAMREHEAILDALRRRAGEELGNVLFLHLRSTQDAAAQDLDERRPADIRQPESSL
jgi:DNA-binding GntR family transcriptional regulator